MFRRVTEAGAGAGAGAGAEAEDGAEAGANASAAQAAAAAATATSTEVVVVEEGEESASPPPPPGVGATATKEETHKPQQTTDATTSSMDKNNGADSRTPNKGKEKANSSGSAGTPDSNSSDNVRRALSQQIVEGEEEVTPGGGSVESAASEGRGWAEAAGGGEGAFEGAKVEGKEEKKKRSRISQERTELAKQRQDVAALVAQGEEGLAFVKQSIDMADILRGFVITRHGVPVRDVDRELLLQGRSAYRDRFVWSARCREHARAGGSFLLLALVIRPSTTHPSQDGAHFLLLLETDTSNSWVSIALFPCIT